MAELSVNNPERILRIASTLGKITMNRLSLLAASFAFTFPAYAAESSQHYSASFESKATSAQEGASFETAVVIQAANESDGVKAEYAWIKKNIPGGRPAGQSLLSHDGKMFDLIHVILPDDSVRDVYFDISSYFGKM